jgi:hypothetical protein
MTTVDRFAMTGITAQNILRIEPRYLGKGGDRSIVLVLAKTGHAAFVGFLGFIGTHGHSGQQHDRDQIDCPEFKRVHDYSSELDHVSFSCYRSHSPATSR